MNELNYTSDLDILDEYRSTYSDAYKEAYGFRPRFIDYEDWTIRDFEVEMEYLQTIIERNMVEYQDIQDQAIREFERLVTNTIELGAPDRNTAIRWILDGEEDIGYFEWKNSLPYGYLKEFY